MKRSLIFTMVLATALVILSSASSGANYGGQKYGSQAMTTAYTEASPMVAQPVFTPEIRENGMADSDIETETEVMYYTEDEVVMMAKLLYRECGGVPSDTEKACVAWTVCNRVDSDEFDGDTITDVMTERNQFAYDYDTPVSDELYELALDVLTRWNSERNGEMSVGRVLPKDYFFFSGDGAHNHFRTEYKGGTIYDYYMESPYES